MFGLVDEDSGFVQNLTIRLSQRSWVVLDI